MKIYISGSISNNPNYKDDFKRAEEHICFLGHEVINPTDIPLGYSYKEYIDIDLMMLMRCDAIYMISGWQESKGALLEHAYALTTGMMILYEDKMRASA